MAALLVSLPLLAWSGSALSIPGLPVAQADEFIKSSHKFWLVIDASPGGISCRWSEEMPKQWYAAQSVWPRMNIWDWPVIRTFTYGLVLVANQTPAGYVLLADDRGDSWLKVRIGDRDEICLVRAKPSLVMPLVLQ